MQVAALLLILINLAMALVLFPAISLLVFLTNWIVLLTLATVLLTIWNQQT